MTHSSSSIGISFAILMFYGASITGTILLSRDNGADKEVLLQNRINHHSESEYCKWWWITIETWGLHSDTCRTGHQPARSVSRLRWFCGMGFTHASQKWWLAGRLQCGYWHASAPTPLRYSSENLVTYLNWVACWYCCTHRRSCNDHSFYWQR